jgi:hypothetical protein
MVNRKDAAERVCRTLPLRRLVGCRHLVVALLGRNILATQLAAVDHASEAVEEGVDAEQGGDAGTSR